MGIPRHLHRILVNGYEPGEEAERWWREFERLHPAWAAQTWRDPVDPEDYELGRLFSSCTSGAQLADLLRIEVLWKHGGVYVDSDVEPLRPFDALAELDFFVGTEDGDNIGTAVIGAAPGHPILRALMDRLLEYDALPSELPPNKTTGPALFGRVLNARDDVVVLPREVFFPYNPTMGTTRYDDWSQRHAICAHHWQGSWVPSSDDLSPRTRLLAAPVAMKRSTKRVARSMASRLVGSSAEGRSKGIFGVYVGENRVLVATTAGFPLQAIADDLSITPELVARGWYDDYLLAFMDRVLRPGDWFVDVGANVGLMSLAAAHRVGRWGRVLAFEADPEVAAICQENVRMNWLQNTDVHSAAVGARSGSTTLLRLARQRGLSVADVGAERGDIPHGSEEIEVRVVDLDTNVPPVAPIRLAKVDVEGGELAVLQGMSQLLADGRLDYLALETKRENLGRQWKAFLDALTGLVEHHGACLSSLTRRGELRSISVPEIETAESFPHVIVDLTGAH